MEAIELEDGETCSFRNHEDVDASIDLDVAYSYIDEKIQDVLGHFQKDFEGGVSAENLGAKFGGYGSFLPVIQRSPLLSHPKTPQEVSNRSMPISPNHLPFKDGCHNSAVSSTTLSLRTGPTSTSSTSRPSTKGPAGNESSVKKEKHKPLSQAEEPTPKNGSINKKPIFKVRIKVGSDNLSTQKNAALYCGLGLDVSPSPSLDGTASDSEGLSHEFQDSPCESPTSIVQIMTSFPIYGDMMLSPLPDDFIFLTEKAKPMNNNGSLHIPGNGCKSIYSIGCGADIVKGSGKVSKKKNKPMKRDDFSAEPKGGGNKYSRNGIMFMPEKEQEIDASTFDGLVSHTLKLPLLSSVDLIKSESKRSAGKAYDISREASKVVIGDEKVRSFDEITEYSKKHGHHEEERTFDSRNEDLTEKAMTGELMDAPQQKAVKKSTANEHKSIRSTSGNENSITDRKGKSKGSKKDRIPLAGDVTKGSLRISYQVPKIKNSTIVDNKPKTENEDIKSQKESGKNTDRYRDFFGELEEEENRTDAPQMLSEDLLKHSESSNVYEKSSSANINGAPKERLGVKRKIVKPLTSEATPKAISNLDTAPSATNPVLIKENWVCCDKCQKWRLLPLGIEPANLPDKWICTMLNWLPGMNRCTVEESETNNAVVALYQEPVLEAPTGVNFANNTMLLNQAHNNGSLNAMPIGGKKKTSKQGATLLSSSMKRNIQASTKSRSLNDVNQSPLGYETNVQHLSKSNDLNIGNQEHKPREKQKALPTQLAQGDIMSFKVRKRTDQDPNISRTPKKIKTEGIDSIDEDRISGLSGPVRKVVPSSSNGFSNTSRGKPGPKDTDLSYKNMKYNAKDGSVGIENVDSKGNGKKRKLKDHLVIQPHLDAHHENESIREKRARVCKSEGKESSASKGSGTNSKKQFHLNNQQLVRDVDPLKREVGCVQHAVAATSSSSKISGSHKTRSSFLDVKSSPVESVSSSPMRSSNPDKLVRAYRGIKKNDVSHRDALFAATSPGRCLYGEDGGNDRSQMVRSKRQFSVLDFENVGLDDPSCDTKTLGEPMASEQCLDEDRRNDICQLVNESGTRKLGKGPSARLKDKKRSSNSEFEIDKIKNQNSLDELRQRSLSDVKKPKDGKSKLHKDVGLKSDDLKKKTCVTKEDPIENLSKEGGKRESRINSGVHEIPDVRGGDDCRKGAISTSKQNRANEKSSNRSGSEKTDQLELVSLRGKTLPLVSSGGAQNEMLQVNSSEGNDTSSRKTQIRKIDYQNGTRHISSRHPISNGLRASAEPSPARRNFSNLAANKAFKEAKDLKHMADRLKNPGSNLERIGLYFQAALKFLHAASLMESGNTESFKHSEMIQSIEIYSDTAKLCDFCAREYETSKDMASAALAYKCMEVAYMRVVYSSHNSASRDRQELQKALQLVPSGESPSSSVSDIDNLNNPLTTVEKAAVVPKGVSSPQLAGNLIMTSRNHSNFVRMLNFAQDVSFAMEAATNSRVAYAAVVASVGGEKNEESISCLKKALDFNFQDVEGLLHLVRLGMEPIKTPE